MFGPLIDSPPAHPDTVLTTLVHAENVLQEQGTHITHLVADMQMYKVALQIKWSDQERWKHLVLRPGGMHMLMSFIGCIGILMRCTGLEDLLGCAFAGVPNMMNGKAWPKALRGLHMVTTALLDDIHSRGISAVDLQAELENARKLPTGRLWVDCLVIPIAIIHMFIRAERESDWLLHLYCVQQMLPYFFAAGHANYARYGAWYILEMRGAFPAATRQMFLNGDHVCRHRSGVWNFVFSDKFGEQTYSRYGKAKCGLVGITLNPDHVAGWVLSYHICNTVSLAMDHMFDNEEDGEMGGPHVKHHEEGLRRRRLDADDRAKIKEELTQHTHPFKVVATSPMNIMNGHIGGSNVNVRDAAELGTEMLRSFYKDMPSGFYNSIRKRVTTMETAKKGVKVGDGTVFDMEKLYGRMLVVSQQRHIDLRRVFSYELAPHPLSLFDEFGDMRKGTKATLVTKLAVLTSSVEPPDLGIVDGNAMILHVNWPKSGTVHTYVNSFRQAVKRDHHVIVVFDRYRDNSIKSHERDRRTSGVSKLDIQLDINTPLPARDRVISNVKNKTQLIQHLCQGNQEPSVDMVGDDECIFGHEEADVNMVSYALMMSREHGCQQIQIVSDDTDVFVLLVHFYWKLRPLAAITMKRFDGKTIYITATAMALGHKCVQLLHMHAITGCDSVSYPFGKGKVSSLKVIVDSDDLDIEVFGESNATISDVMCTGCRMFGHLYGAKCGTTMNALRYKIFSTRLNVPTLKSLPPTDDSLALHLKRAHIQAMLWKAADRDQPPNVCLCDFGWEMSAGTPSPVRASKPVGLPELMKVIACSCSSDKP